MVPGTRVASYEILSALGAGGMGEVYRARDAKLNRDVAIKVLLPAVANDPDRLARFSREAQVLASLNHPNIAAIYGIEETSGVTALVMELVEGEDLSQRIARGAIPIDETLPIARQIADALEAAHDLGIIHRDLKPANIKLRSDGTVKVLDFGLAKQGSGIGDQGSGDLANSPTLSMHGTQAGIILGTAAYMAPEQAKGKAVDKRADVWAFGVVLYEMLTGVKAFPGEDISDTLATLLKFEPDWNRLPAATPSSIRRLLRRCLIKDPKLRLRECGSAIVEIDEAASGVSDSSAAAFPAQEAKSTWRRWVMPAVAAIAIIAMAGVTVRTVWRDRDAPQLTKRFAITLADSQMLAPGSGTLLALSPDGRMLVYRANAPNGPSQLYRRPIDQFGAVVLRGTENGREPLFFSPDSQWLVFQVDETVKKIALAGGPSQTLATKSTTSRGGSWAPDGRIVIGDAQGGSLWAVPASAGAATALFKGDGFKLAWYPQILAGGKLLLFTLSLNQADGGDLHLLDLESGTHRLLMANATAGRILPSGHLVFVRGAALWAVPFDVTNPSAIGTAVPVVEGVRVEGGGAVQYTVSDEGTLAYIPGTAQRSGERSLAFVTRDGKFETLAAPLRQYEDLALSPDQTRVAVQIGTGTEADIWVVDVARGTLTRITREPGFDGRPLWSKDGSAIVFASSGNAQHVTIQRKSADGTGVATTVATFGQAASVRPNSWSPDGTTLLVQVDSTIASIAADGESQPKVLMQSGARPVVSPDGRWLAYESDESGEGQVYLQRFPDLGDRRVVSTSGGWMPSWSRDGRELFYLRGGPPNAVMRVKVQTNADGGAEIGSEAVLAAFQYYSPRIANRTYDVTPDAQRLLVISNTSDTDNSSRNQINIVTNWFDELKRLVPIR